MPAKLIHDPTLPCDVEDCARRRQVHKAMCAMHAARLRRHGTTSAHVFRRAPSSSPAQRYERWIDRDGPLPEFRPELGQCWVWRGLRATTGYGKISTELGQEYVHRYVYRTVHGEIPKGKEIDHLCRTRACSRPTHLEAVTHAVNMQRGMAGKPQTHCRRGHEFGVSNFHVDGRGNRWCLVCRAVALDRKNARRREARKARRNALV